MKHFVVVLTYHDGIAKLRSLDAVDVAIYEAAGPLPKEDLLALNQVYSHDFTSIDQLLSCDIFYSKEMPIPLVYEAMVGLVHAGVFDE